MKAVCLAAFLVFGLGSAAAADCRLALLLAVDVSSSISDGEYTLQRDGLAHAVLDPEVQAAPLPRSGHWVSLALFEWSGKHQSVIRLDWIAMQGPADILYAAETISKSPRSKTEFPTALGHALGFEAAMLSTGPVRDQSKIDVSGDGPNNEEFVPAVVYATGLFNDIVVNGLAIEANEPGLTEYYRREVAFGTGAFVISANGFNDFKRAMALKLLRELQEIELSDAGHAPKVVQ